MIHLIWQVYISFFLIKNNLLLENLWEKVITSYVGIQPYYTAIFYKGYPIYTDNKAYTMGVFSTPYTIQLGSFVANIINPDLTAVKNFLLKIKLSNK